MYRRSLTVNCSKHKVAHIETLSIKRKTASIKSGHKAKNRFFFFLNKKTKKEGGLLTDKIIKYDQ